jgi:hypothetical protein
MRRIQLLAAAVVIAIMDTSCYAACNCDDWMNRGGYCDDYVKTKISTFPIPKTDAEIAALNNKGIPEVSEGPLASSRRTMYNSATHG